MSEGSGPSSLALPRAPLLARFVFAAYALALFIATHWPKLRLPEGIPRSDLWIHAVAFALWTGLCIACCFFAPRPSTRPLTPRNIWTCLPLGIAVAGFDELTQMIPVLNRTAAWDDFGADSVGVLLAVVTALALARRRAPAANTAPSTPGA